MYNFKKKIYLKIIFLICFFAIISAYYIEYILGHQPCSLCIIERMPYILGLVILLLNYKFKDKENFFIMLLVLTFIFSLIISIYHFGIEQGFFQESIICSVENGSKILTKENLLLELQKKQVSCKDVTFKIFGFSLTTVNIIISLILLFITTKIFMSYEKNK